MHLRMREREMTDAMKIAGGPLRWTRAPKSNPPATPNARRHIGNWVGKAVSVFGVTRLSDPSRQPIPSLVDPHGRFPKMRRKISMKAALPFVAGLACAILSIAPADAAQPANAVPTSFQTVDGAWGVVRPIGPVAPDRAHRQL
jgi:hypothetical protein